MTQKLNNKEFVIEYVELYTPSSKLLAYWHVNALKFTLEAYSDPTNSTFEVSSYLLKSDEITLLLTSTHPTMHSAGNREVGSFVANNYHGIKRVAVRSEDVVEDFENAVANGAFPLKFPRKTSDDFGFVEEASVKLYDQSEIVFINTTEYKGTFKPGFKKSANQALINEPMFSTIDHIASEVRINESLYWSDYLGKTLNLSIVQSFEQNEENKTGMTLRVNQSIDKKLTFVIAEPASYKHKSKVQDNIDNFGPGFHHLAFLTEDLIQTSDVLGASGVEFVKIPDSYYELLRTKEEFQGFDIERLQRNGVLIDKEDDTYLLQKFLKPITDRPFFFYEIVQRVNGYHGFALKNINVLKKAEEMEIMKQG